MFDVDRILAIPDESVDYLQMGISGGERAALAARGFVRKDGTKAKDSMIRTIKKTAKNKAKAEKVMIKGDKPLAEAPNKKELEQRLAKINQELQTPYLVGAKFKPLAVSNPDRFESLSKEAKEINRSLGNKKREFYESTQDQASRLLRMPAARHKKYVEDALKSGKTVPDEVLKDYPDLSKKYSQSPSNRGMAVTYNKKGDLSEGSAAKKIKAAIATTSATPKSRKVVKGMSPRDRDSNSAQPKIEFKSGDLATIKTGLERAKTGNPKKIKSSKLISRNKAVELLYPSSQKSKQKDSLRNYTTNQIKRMAKRYPDLGWDNKKFDYNPDKALVGDTLEYIRPTFEQKEKGLVSQFLKVSSVKNGKVYGTPVDKNGKKLSDKQIPVISTPTASNLPKGNRYLRLIDLAAIVNPNPSNPQPQPRN